jgi:hypothetical protein
VGPDFKLTSFTTVRQKEEKEDEGEETPVDELVHHASTELSVNYPMPQPADYRKAGSPFIT